MFKKRPERGNVYSFQRTADAFFLRQSFGDHIERFLRQPQQHVVWIQEALDAARLVAARAEPLSYPHAVTVFWLRLFGCLVDLRRWAEGTRAACDEADELAADHPVHGAIANLCKVVDDLREGFSRKELFFIDYARQGQAHPSPHAFEHRALDNRKYKSQIFGLVDILEAQVAIEHILGEYGGSAAVAAGSFATRAIQPLERMLPPFVAWQTVF